MFLPILSVLNRDYNKGSQLRTVCIGEHPTRNGLHVLHDSVVLGCPQPYLNPKP